VVNDTARLVKGYRSKRRMWLSPLDNNGPVPGPLADGRCELYLRGRYDRNSRIWAVDLIHHHADRRQELLASFARARLALDSSRTCILSCRVVLSIFPRQSRLPELM
jgi:hypothetical protein